MDDVSLQNRTDTKFVFSRSKLTAVLEQLFDEYRILKVDSEILFRYENIYFDFEDRRLYMRHHRGAKNRFKVRKRRYVESDLNWLEVKFKNNKGRTIKFRRKLDEYKTVLDPGDLIFLEKILTHDPHALIPQVNIGFHRMTLVQKDHKDRLTIDVDLSYKDEDGNGTFGGLVIAELKQATYSVHSPFIQVMRKERIQPLRMSKYCFSMVNAKEGLKYNRFKPRILQLNKISNGAIVS